MQSLPQDKYNIVCMYVLYHTQVVPKANKKFAYINLGLYTL